MPADSPALDLTTLLGEWFSAAPLGLAIFDRERRFVHLNDALARMNGKPVEAHLGHTPREVLAEALADVLEPLVAKALETGEAREIDLVDPDDGDRRYSVAYFPLLGPGGGPPLAVAAMVHGTHRAGGTGFEVHLRATEERLRLLLDGTQTGAWEWDVPTGRIRWTEAVGPLHGLPRGWQPPDLETYLELVHPDDAPALRAQARAAAEHGRPWESEMRVLVDGGRERWLHTRAFVQLDAQGRPRTVIGITADITERRRREQAARFLSDASLMLAEPLSADAMLQQIADLAVPALGDWCAVYRFDEDGALARVAVAHTDPEKLSWALQLATRYPPQADGPTGPPAVARSGRSELYPTISPELLRVSARDEEHLRLLETLRLRSALIVPLTGRDGPLGAITFIHADSGREYDEHDLAVAEDLGRRAGLALESARLQDAERAARVRLEAVGRIVDVGLTHLDQQALLDELLARVAELTRADRAAILLRHGDDDALTTMASIGVDSEATPPVRIPLGRGVAGRIAESRAPLLVEDLAAVDGLSPHLAERGRSLAGVPLLLGGELLGVLHVSSRDRRFDDADLELLELVADRAAQAIRHSQLYEAQRETALALQRSLLPPRLPEMPGLEIAARYLPGVEGAEVGGDWYDAFALPDGRIALVVGDVVGRGLHAAARMGQLRTALRAYAFEADAPAVALERLDRFVAGPESVRFATLVLAFLDVERGTAQVCSAGHLPPLIVDADGSARLATVAAGPPLGFGESSRVATALELGDGATLVLYTDGLVEDRTIGLIEGLARLEAAAATDGCAEQLADRVVERMTAERSQDDDVALLAVRRAGGLARTFPAEPAAVAAARHAVSAYAARLGANERALQDIALAVSEACTNIVLHAYRETDPGAMHVSARADDDGLLVEVADEGGGLRPRGDSPGVGLGLQIIARTTQRFDVEEVAGGGTRLLLRFALVRR